MSSAAFVIGALRVKVSSAVALYNELSDFRSLKQCCLQETRSGGLVSRFKGVQRVGLMLKLSGLSGQEVKGQIRADEENESRGR